MMVCGFLCACYTVIIQNNDENMKKLLGNILCWSVAACVCRFVVAPYFFTQYFRVASSNFHVYLMI